MSIVHIQGVTTIIPLDVHQGGCPCLSKPYTWCSSGYTLEIRRKEYSKKNV